MGGPRPGHVFVTQGDIRLLSCDAWLMSANGTVSVVGLWKHEAHIRWMKYYAQSVLSGLAPTPSFREKGNNFQSLEPKYKPVAVKRSARVHWVQHPLPPEQHPAVYALDVVARFQCLVEKREWEANGLKEALLIMYNDAIEAKRECLHGRERFLFAVPVVGTGGGGNSFQTGEATKVILATLLQLVQEHPFFDVILCAYDRPTFVLAQQARLEAIRDFFPSLVAEPPFMLPSQYQSVFDMTESLAQDFDEGRLVLFLGNGINNGAGMPDWADLLDEMAAECGLETTSSSWKYSDNLSKADLIDNRFRRSGKTLADWTSQRAKRVANCLMHQLIIGLRCKEVVTTNIDQCYEKSLAILDSSIPLSVIPHHVSKDAQHWLLKLHGCVTAPSSVVATRGDYLRFMESKNALAGIVQAKLLTSKILFLGFSLDDENFHKIMDSVVKARQGSDSRIGITFQDFHNQFAAELWSPAIECASMQDIPKGPITHQIRSKANRQAELVMDLLCLQSSRHYSGYILDRRFKDSLTPEETILSDALRTLGDQLTLSELEQFPIIKTTLSAYGKNSGYPMAPMNSFREHLEEPVAIPASPPTSSGSIRSKIVSHLKPGERP